MINEFSKYTQGEQKKSVFDGNERTVVSDLVKSFFADFEEEDIDNLSKVAYDVVDRIAAGHPRDAPAGARPERDNASGRQFDDRKVQRSNASRHGRRG